MKKSDFKDAEAAQLADLLCSTSNVNEVNSLLESLPQDEMEELCTTILRNGHTIIHLLAQRQKLTALQAVLFAGVDVHTRDAQGCTPLLVALQHNALFAAKVLLDHGANPGEVVSRPKGTALLHLMVTCDRPHAVMLLLQEKADSNARDANQRTPFHLAAIYGNTVIAAILMRHELCDVNAVDGVGHTGVMLAIRNNNQELARQLVEAPGIDIVRRDKDGMSCLHMAVSLGQLEVVRSLLRRNTANINSKELRMGRTPIHFACALDCRKDGTVCSNFLTKNAPADDASVCEDVSGHGDSLNNTAHTEDDGTGILNTSTPRLHNGDLVTDPVNDLQKVNLPSVHKSRKDRPGSSHHKKLLALVNGNTTPRTPREGSLSARSYRNITPRTSTPRQLSARDFKRSSRAVEASPRTRTRSSVLDMNSVYNVRHSISVDSLGGPYRAPLQQNYFMSTPSKSRHSSASEMIRSHRPSTAPVTGSNLHRQFESAFPVSQLTFKIPSANTGRDSAGSHRSRDNLVMVVTPLTVGVIRCKLVALLLDHGADANLMTTFRKSPLHITSIMGTAEIMSLMLPHITNINVLSAGNKTALHLATEGGFTSVASQLIQMGANLNMRDMAGMSALHLAARAGHYHIVSLLLNAKAEKNCCDFRQMMPLHHACLHGHGDIAELLVRAGAELNFADDDGFRPLDYQKKMSLATKSAPGDIVGPATSSTSSIFNDSTDSTVPPHTPRQDLPQRRRKMGIIHSMNGHGVPPIGIDYQPPFHSAPAQCNGSA